MAEVVLFHHAQGLTPGVVAFADELRRAGHIVHAPDLFEGRTFGTVEEGVAYARETGFAEVLERGVRAAEGLSAESVYAGFSLGVMPAQRLAQTRPAARVALLFHACLPVSEFGPSWPDGVPVQVHARTRSPADRRSDRSFSVRRGPSSLLARGRTSVPRLGLSAGRLEAQKTKWAGREYPPKNLKPAA